MMGNTTKRRVAARLVTGACAYVVALSTTAASGDAKASLQMMAPSACHADVDNFGTNLSNSGTLTYSGSASAGVYCPIVEGSYFATDNTTDVHVFGSEGSVDGSSSRACECDVDTVLSCFCGTGVNWVNNDGEVAANLSTSAPHVRCVQAFGGGSG